MCALCAGERVRECVFVFMFVCECVFVYVFVRVCVGV